MRAHRERVIARDVWRSWVRAQGWDARQLAARLGVDLARGYQVHRGRLLPSVPELARLGPLGTGFLVTLQRALRRPV